MNLFVTGTDTDVGKTVISAWICSKLNTSYLKLIQTGEDSDSSTVRRFAPKCEILNEIYNLSPPLSAYNAAQIEGVHIDTNKFFLDIDKTVIEGAGGVFVPIAENFLMIDAIKRTNSAALVVVRSRLGMINHTLLTVHALKTRQIDVIGIVVVGNVDEEIKTTIERFSVTKVLAVLPETNDLVKLLADTPLPHEILEVLT